MRRRLIVSTGLIALAAVLVLGVPLGIVRGAARPRGRRLAGSSARPTRSPPRVDDRVEAGRRDHRPRRCARSCARATPSSWSRPDGRAHRRRPAAAAATSLTERSGAAQAARVTASEPRSEVDHRRARRLAARRRRSGPAASPRPPGWPRCRRGGSCGRCDTMAGTSRRLGQGDFSARAGRFGIPELDVVAEALDASAERIAEMVGREREFSGNVSHQLRTPLTALRLRLEEVAELEDPAERARRGRAGPGRGRPARRDHRGAAAPRARRRGADVVDLDVDDARAPPRRALASAASASARRALRARPRPGRRAGAQLARGRRAGARRAARERAAPRGAGRSGVRTARAGPLRLRRGRGRGRGRAGRRGRHLRAAARRTATGPASACTSRARWPPPTRGSSC